MNYLNFIFLFAFNFSFGMLSNLRENNNRSVEKEIDKDFCWGSYKEKFLNNKPKLLIDFEKKIVSISTIWNKTIGIQETLLPEKIKNFTEEKKNNLNGKDLMNRIFFENENDDTYKYVGITFGRDSKICILNSFHNDKYLNKNKNKKNCLILGGGVGGPNEKIFLKHFENNFYWIDKFSENYGFNAISRMQINLEQLNGIDEIQKFTDSKFINCDLFDLNKKFFDEKNIDRTSITNVLISNVLHFYIKENDLNKYSKDFITNIFPKLELTNSELTINSNYLFHIDKNTYRKKREPDAGNETLKDLADIFKKKALEEKISWKECIKKSENIDFIKKDFEGKEFLYKYNLAPQNIFNEENIELIKSSYKKIKISLPNTAGLIIEKEVVLDEFKNNKKLLDVLSAHHYSSLLSHFDSYENFISFLNSENSILNDKVKCFGIKIDFTQR